MKQLYFWSSFSFIVALACQVALTITRLMFEPAYADSEYVVCLRGAVTLIWIVSTALGVIKFGQGSAKNYRVTGSVIPPPDQKIGLEPKIDICQSDWPTSDTRRVR
jgi:hypothetical protein